MTETTMAPEVPAQIPDDISALSADWPKIRPLDPEAALQACDGHANQAVNAIASVEFASGNDLLMCGHCARKNFGWEHTKYTPEDNRQKGSAH